jgi:hypothetical protein
MHARIDAISTIWMGCVGRPNRRAVIDTSADRIGRAGGTVYDCGGLIPHARVMNALRLLAREVKPQFQQLARRACDKPPPRFMIATSTKPLKRGHEQEVFLWRRGLRI